MAIHEGYEQINTITGLDVPWEGKTGMEVEDFISRRLKNPLGNNITYENSVLTIYNPEGDPIAQGNVTVVPPNYTTELQFPQIVVNGNTKEGDVEVNYTESLIFRAGINVKTFYESTGNFYDLSSKVSITFYIEGTTDQLIVDNISPNKREDDSLQFIDITPLFQTNRQGATLKATVTANSKTSTVEFPGKITIHKIELSTSSTHVADKTVVFDIKGLNSATNMNLEYYDVPLGTDNLNSIELKRTPVTSNTRAELPLSIGGHQLLARVSNADGTFYSNWIQANVVSHDETNKTDMLAIIGGIPSVINNCENVKLFQIISVPGLGGDVEIVSYLADDPGVFQDDMSTWPEFNRTSLSTDSNDNPTVSDYYSYIELENVNNATKAVAFSLIINDVNYNLYALDVVNGYLSGKKVFTMDIKENPYNVNNAFNHVAGAIEDFSQIKGQSTTLFTGISSNIEASDGWTIDENLIAYKISGQGRNLFETPKNFSSLLSSGRGFTIETMLKNYNCNGDDPVMSIGNLLFGPGYARVQSANEEILTNSRADFEKDEMTHLMFVFDPAYKPATYNNIYDQLFDEGGTKFSGFNDPYPILKVYVNGTINREIEIKTTDLATDDGFKFQINPISSDLNLYIFRTYNWAFNYAEIQKNFISSRQTSTEKKEIYDRNNILGADGRVSFYKTMQNNNVMVVVLPPTDKPLYFGNRKTNGDGVDPNDPDAKAQATLLVHYKDEKYKASNGRFTGGKYKAQGSSAKKYMIHNVQYGSGKFISEDDIKAGLTKTSKTYAMPTDDEGIKAKKFVGKVNYASSMQSHKLGSVKLFDKAYKQSAFPSTYAEKLYTGGKKACLEEAFVYFYYNLKPGQDISTITIDDLYTIETINGIVVPQDQDVKYFGFQTWGSGKADDPTYGYDDSTLEYLLVEGADNGSTGANFKQPWAAFQTWTPTVTYDGHKNDPKYIVQQPQSITDPASTKYDPTAGLLIEGETIKFDANGTDPWDIDYGLTELDEDNDLWEFTDEVKAKGSSLEHFVAFYNNCYTYDFTNLKQNPDPDPTRFELFNKYGIDDHRVYMTRQTVKLYDKNDAGEIVEVDSATTFDTYRWDSRIDRWVPAGLHHNGSKWEKFNLKSIFSNITRTDLFAEYSENADVMDKSKWLGRTISDTDDVPLYIYPAFRDMFRAGVEKYCDKEDIIYHQAFIRLVSGTDNRAKNTYFQIIGKVYTNKAMVDGVEVDLVKIAEGDYKKKKGYIDDTNTFIEVSISGDTVTPTGFTLPAADLEVEDLFWKQTDKGDYKIRLMQDDMDTIFATDNNGQQVKPYYLLEPAFNKSTEKLWGDHHSSFFYPFDACYYKEINSMVGSIIRYLVGNATTIKDKTTLLYDYFFKTQLEYPEILYNHHAEIYYEMPQTLYRNGKLRGFGNTLSGFANNNVINPLSLSHGRCIESEYQFMKDRLLLLGTQSNSAHGLYGNEWALSSEGSGGNEGGATFLGTVEYTDYIYPILTYKRSNGDEYTKLFNLSKDSDIAINYDKLFKSIEDAPGIPTTISQLATPARKYPINLTVDTTIPSYIASANKIKTIDVLQGLDKTHALPNLPSANYININGRTANYSINTIDIAVKDYLPIIENLNITNATFSNSLLDFRNCNRLSNINLQGCIGIKNIIFPENNRLSSIYLPNDLKQISLGVIPNLSIFDIPDGTKFTSVSLDCSNLNRNFDYIGLLKDYVDYGNLTSFVLNNTPADGLVITEDIASKLADIQLDSSIQKSIKGKFIIKDRHVSEDASGEITYSWGSKTVISYATKKKLVKAFGKIDSINNSVYFDFEDYDLDSHIMAPEIAVDVPVGGITVYPFEGLSFQIGNDVLIKDDGTLAIEYSLVNAPKTVTLVKETGMLTAQENTEKSYIFNISVTKTDGTKYPNISGSLYLGYKAPKVGDFAYSDGTFSTAPNPSKTLVGMVYQVDETIAGSEWKLCILGTGSVSGAFGADLYCYNAAASNASNLIWSESGANTQEQQAIFTFMKSGLGLSMTVPTESVYLGTAADTYEHTDSIDRNYVVPSTLVESGLSYTEAFAAVGLNRLETYAKNNSVFQGALKSKKYFDNNRVQNLDTIEAIEDVCSMLNTAAGLVYPSGVDYSKVLNPIYLKALAYEPANLEGDFAKTSYSKGNWYIPSIKELELLIYYRIMSTTKATDNNIPSYWDSEAYGNGNSIFTSTSSDFKAFLDSDMVAAQASTQNKNYAYGTIRTNTYPVVTYYKWGFTYPFIDQQWVGDGVLDTCMRDITRTVTPCCQVTVTKS